MLETDPSGLDSIRIDGFLATGWSISKNGLGSSNYGWADKGYTSTRLVGSVEYDLAAAGGNPIAVLLGDEGWSYKFPDGPFSPVDRTPRDDSPTWSDYQKTLEEPPIPGFFHALNLLVQNVTGADEVEADMLTVGVGGLSGPEVGMTRLASTEALTYSEIGGEALNLTERMSKSAFGRLTKDIATNGLQDTVINYVEIGGENYVVHGNNRVKAARRLGITDQLRFEKVALPFPANGQGFRTEEDVINAWAEFGGGR